MKRTSDTSNVALILNFQSVLKGLSCSTLTYYELDISWSNKASSSEFIVSLLLIVHGIGIYEKEMGVGENRSRIIRVEWVIRVDTSFTVDLLDAIVNFIL
jgi:hypothetical protein